MTERDFTAKLLRALRQHAALKGAVIWKLNDRTTMGIPDFVVTLNERTTWWEVKVWPNVLTKIQCYYLMRLRLSWCVILQKGIVLIRPQGMPVNSYFSFETAIAEIVRRCRDA